METATESRCCREIERVVATMEAEDVHSCITDHPGSRSDCLDVLVLRIAYLAYKEQYDGMQQDGNRYRNMCSSLMLRYSQKQLINQSINQTSIAPISPAKPGSEARQPNQCSTAKSRKQFRNINRLWGVTVPMGGGQIKEMCLQIFLEGSN